MGIEADTYTEQGRGEDGMRRIIGRLLGFTEEIERLEARIRELSWDGAFGMWTRGAFLNLCELMPRTRRWVAFLDFDDIHGLNLRMGYRWVDERIRRTFSIPFRSSDVIARWYSGDEIVILFDGLREGAELKLEQLHGSARRQGLSFRHALGSWDVGEEELEGVVEGLSAEVAAAKRERPAPRRAEWGRPAAAVAAGAD